jgi:hypothetical protein
MLLPTCDFDYLKKKKTGSFTQSVAEHVLSMCEALGPSLNTRKINILLFFLATQQILFTAKILENTEKYKKTRTIWIPPFLIESLLMS